MYVARRISIPFTRYSFINKEHQMRKLTFIFWLIFCLFVYKISFIEKDQPDTHYKFSIARDQHGIPHIYGKNYEDIFFGLGYAEAQDRLFSIYFRKMFVEGRTAEMFGPDCVASDLEMRNIGLQEMGKANKPHTDPETIKLIQAYADGINNYAKTVKMLPFEFYLFWLSWQDWTVEDTLAYVNLLSFTLQFDWFYQIARQRLLETVGFDLTLKLINFGERNLFRKVTIVNDQELKDLGLFDEYDYSQEREILKKHWLSKNMTLGSLHLPHITGSYEGSGSNAWLIGGEHTVTGRPILANDPHVGSLIPNMFYYFQAVLLTEKNQIKSRKFGAMPDGIPTVSIGISEIAAWGSTAAYIDNKDVYYQTIRNNSGKLQYKFKDEWHDFRERKEIIKVRGSQDVEEIFYHTHRGVVIQSIFMDIHWKYGYPMPQQYKDNHTLTLVATHFTPDNTSAKGLVSMLTFETSEQFWDINKAINHPNIDSVFIASNLSYGYAPVGAIPSRKIPQMGSFIKDGNSDEYETGRSLLASQKTITLDPKRGYFCLGNNKFASNNYKHRSSIHQIVTGRAFTMDKLIREKIANKQKFSFQDVMEMQLSQHDGFLCEVLPKFLGSLSLLRKIWSNPQTEALFAELTNWNCNMSKQSVPASIYHVWQQLFLESLLLMTSLSEHERHSIVSHAFFQNYYFNLLERFGNHKLQDDDKIVCTNAETNLFHDIHPCEANIALTFKKLPDELQRLFGSEYIKDYQWGKIHYQTFKIIPFSEVPIIKNFWSRDYPAGGNSRTLNVAIHVHQAQKYDSLVSPAYRFITDLNTTYFSIEAGTTDRILSPFFDNFLNKNKYVQYVPRNPYQEGLPANWTFTVEILQ